MMLFEQIDNFPFLVMLIQKLRVDVFFVRIHSPAFKKCPKDITEGILYTKVLNNIGCGV
jgi:hypothetical protein